MWVKGSSLSRERMCVFEVKVKSFARADRVSGSNLSNSHTSMRLKAHHAQSSVVAKLCFPSLLLFLFEHSSVIYLRNEIFFPEWLAHQSYIRNRGISASDAGHRWPQEYPGRRYYIQTSKVYPSRIGVGQRYTQNNLFDVPSRLNRSFQNEDLWHKTA